MSLCISLLTICLSDTFTASSLRRRGVILLQILAGVNKRLSVLARLGQAGARPPATLKLRRQVLPIGYPSNRPGSAAANRRFSSDRLALPSAGRRAPIGFGQQRDRMDDAHGEVLIPRAVDDLQQTPRVASGNDARLGAADVLELPLEQSGGHLRLNQVVDARATAAPSAFGQFNQCQMGNGAEHLPRLCRDFLAVAKMTGLVVSHGLRRNV